MQTSWSFDIDFEETIENLRTGEITCFTNNSNSLTCSKLDPFVAQEGDKLKFTIKITNNTTNDYLGLKPTEFIDEELLLDRSANLDDPTANGLQWDIDLYAMTSQILEYTATVKKGAAYNTSFSNDFLASNNLLMAVDGQVVGLQDEVRIKIDNEIFPVIESVLYDSNNIELRDFDKVSQGDVLRWELSILTNAGAKFSDLFVQIDIPTEFSVLSFLEGKENGESSYSQITNFWTIPNLTIGVDETLVFELQVNDNLSATDLTLSAVFGLSGSTKDSFTFSDNTIYNTSNTVFLEKDIDLAIIDIKVDNNTPSESDTIVYTLEIANLGSTTAKDIVVEMQGLASDGILLYQGNGHFPTHTNNVVYDDDKGVWYINDFLGESTMELTMTYKVGDCSRGLQHNVFAFIKTTDLTYPDSNLSNNNSLEVPIDIANGFNITITPHLPSCKDSAVPVELILEGQDVYYPLNYRIFQEVDSRWTPTVNDQIAVTDVMDPSESLVEDRGHTTVALDLQESYRIVFVDDKGCRYPSDRTQYEYINLPLPLDRTLVEIQSVTSSTICESQANGSTTGNAQVIFMITAGSTQANYHYRLLRQGVELNSDVPISLNSPQTIDNLPSGNYQIEIYDTRIPVKACDVFQDFTIRQDSTGLSSLGIRAVRNCATYDMTTLEPLTENYYAIDVNLSDISQGNSTVITYEIRQHQDNLLSDSGDTIVSWQDDQQYDLRLQELYDQSITKYVDSQEESYWQFDLYAIANGCEYWLNENNALRIDDISLPDTLVLEWSSDSQYLNQFEVVDADQNEDLIYEVVMLGQDYTKPINIQAYDFEEIHQGIFVIPTTADYLFKVRSKITSCERYFIEHLEYLDLVIPSFFVPDSDPDYSLWTPLQDLLDKQYMTSDQRNQYDFFSNIEVTVFDRYGRMLHYFKGVDSGWDGTYNGMPMPSGDYWYMIKFNDVGNRQVVGNVLLRRAY